MKTNNKLLLKSQGSLKSASLNIHKGKYQSTNQRMSNSDTLLLCVDPSAQGLDARFVLFKKVIFPVVVMPLSTIASLWITSRALLYLHYSLIYEPRLLKKIVYLCM